MADARVGASFDLGDVSMAALLDLKGEIAGLHSTMKKIRQDEDRYQQTGPTFVNLQANGTTDANSDPLVLDFGGPNKNRVWEVRQLIIGGLTWNTTVAGNGLVMIQPPPPVSPYALVGMQDHVTSFPAVAFYSAGQFRVYHPNKIYIVILSGSASTPYQGSGDAFDLPNIGGPAVFNS